MNWEKKFTSAIGSRKSVVVHTVVFVGIFALPFFGIDLDTVLLVLTTLVSLEAIYLAIFIQMTVNQNTESLEEVEENIDEIQEDVEELQEDVDEIQEDVEEIQEDVEEIHDEVEESGELTPEAKLDSIRHILSELIKEIDELKSTRK